MSVSGRGARVAALLIVAAGWSAGAQAQAYPVRPVRLIVPYAPGGSSDIIARLYGQRLGETMGQTFVVDNRPGAGGTIGTDLLAKSTADGYTLILQDMPHTINPAVYGKLPHDPVRDFYMVLHHWFGVLAPAGVGKPILTRLHGEFTKALSQPAIVERYKVLMLEPASTTPEEFRALIQSDLARWGKVVREAGIKAQ